MIITSLLDLDLYKLTVGQVFFTSFLGATATYRFTARNADKIDFWRYFDREQFEEEIRHVGTLSLTKNEADYLRTSGLFSEDYIKFLSNAPLKNVAEELRFEYVGGDYYKPVPVATGPLHVVMLYEIFCLSIANEIYAREYCRRNDINMLHVEATGRLRLNRKVKYLDEYNRVNVRLDTPLILTEFGTRRRLSKAWQKEVTKTLLDNHLIAATSNVSLAMELGITPKGTFGHEFPMAMQALKNPKDSQSAAFWLWLNFYGGKLGIALNDTLGEKKFKEDFTKELATRYDGLRHDSGDPLKWANDMLRMYYHFGIDATTKTLMFSDGLDIDTAIQIHRQLHDKCKLGFGVGTNLTNDTLLPVPQVVMKMVKCDGLDVAKISNNPAKACSDNPAYLEYLKSICL